MFEMSDKVELLAVALCNAQAELKGVPFDAENPFYHSKYATLGAVIQAAKGTLAKHGLSLAQFPTGIDGKIGLKNILMHTSGQWIAETIWVQMGNGKNPAQDAGIAISYLRRYSIASILMLYAEEDTDGEGISTQTVATTSEPKGIAWSVVQVTAAIAGGAKNQYEATGALKYSKTIKPGSISEGGTPPGGVTYWFKKYKEARETMEVPEAADHADSEYLAEKARKEQDKTP